MYNEEGYQEHYTDCTHDPKQFHVIGKSAHLDTVGESQLSQPHDPLPGQSSQWYRLRLHTNTAAHLTRSMFRYYRTHPTRSSRAGV